MMVIKSYKPTISDFLILQFFSWDMDGDMMVYNQLYHLVGGLEHLDYFPFHLWDVIRTPLTFTP